MEHRLAQRRMLICAAFFSFGALSGATTFLRLSEAAAERVENLACGFFAAQPLLRIPAAAVVMPLLLLINGPGLIGAVMLCALLAVFGFAGGLLESMEMKAGSFPLVTTSFLILFTLCLLQLGSCMLRRAMRSGGHRRLKTDQSYDSPRIAGAIAVLILAAFAFACFILRH